MRLLNYSFLSIRITFNSALNHITTVSVDRLAIPEICDWWLQDSLESIPANPTLTLQNYASSFFHESLSLTSSIAEGQG